MDINIKVSPEDTDLLFGWKSNTKVYPDGRPYRYKQVSGGFKVEFLRRLVAARMIAPKHLTNKMFVKHQDGDPFNCTRGNLYIVNYKSASPHKRLKTSQYKGVSQFRDKWRVRGYYLDKNGERVRVDIGFFPKEQAEEAALAYDAWASVNLPHAKLNFPDVPGTTSDIIGVKIGGTVRRDV